VWLPLQSWCSESVHLDGTGTLDPSDYGEKGIGNELLFQPYCLYFENQFKCSPDPVCFLWGAARPGWLWVPEDPELDRGDWHLLLWYCSPFRLNLYINTGVSWLRGS